jgi:hypothetical protein
MASGPLPRSASSARVLLGKGGWTTAASASTRTISAAASASASPTRAASPCSTEVLVMKDGVVVEQAHAQQILSAPKEDYTRRLLAAMPRGYRSAAA